MYPCYESDFIISGKTSKVEEMEENCAKKSRKSLNKGEIRTSCWNKRLRMLKIGSRVC